MGEKQNLIDKIAEEINCGNDLGNEPEHIAKNILAIIDGSRKHLDYNEKLQKYDWE